tara:strand:+ start:624 stop:782 length:159 start_codon:yes stop_codon:yes gene_type:complete
MNINKPHYKLIESKSNVKKLLKVFIVVFLSIVNKKSEDLASLLNLQKEYFKT